MKKKGCIWLFGDGWLKKKVFVMKWTVLLVLLGMLQVSAKVHSQHVAIDLKMENSTIEPGIATNYRSDLFEFLL